MKRHIVPLTVYLALMVMALSLGPSFAHLLEAAPRLDWSAELWRETTVFNRQFVHFATIGGPLDVGAILLGVALCLVLRGKPRPFLFACVATALYAASLATWFAVVAPANAVLATWEPGPIPADFDAIRQRWETGHMVMASIKSIGLSFAIGAIISIGRLRAPRHVSAH